MKIRRKKNYIIFVLFLLVCISFGYAVINTTLNINGKSSISKNTWDVYFDNIVVKEESVEVVKIPTITDKTTVDFEVALNLPGDFYEFTVDVVNDGSIDAMIESINKTPSLTFEQQKYLNYIIEYQNKEQILSKQLVKSGGFVRIKVRVEYRSDILEEDMPTTNETLNLGFIINYVQADNNGTKVKDNGIEKVMPVAYNSLDIIGTIVTVGTEQFFVVGTEGDNVKLLAMHNLYVGNIVYEDGNIIPLDNPTGKQSELAKGYEQAKDYDNDVLNYPFVGTTSFSSKHYIASDSFFEIYNGSLVEGYVNDYKTILESDYGIDVVEARLITHEELISIDLNNEELAKLIFSATYWLGSSTSYDYVYYATASRTSYTNYFHEDFCGVRPLIVMNKNDIFVKIKPITDESLDDIGTIVTIGTEKFYVVGTEGENVKLLAMYNLYVGGLYDSINKRWTAYGDEATGKQDQKMKGYILGQAVSGVTAFSSIGTHYNGSIVEGYVNDYKNILESEYGIEVKEARLITKDELLNEDIGCDTSGCSNAVDFIYSTSYYLGTVHDTDYVWCLSSDKYFYQMYYTSVSNFGVRPVIVISKSLF